MCTNFRFFLDKTNNVAVLILVHRMTARAYHIINELVFVNFP